MGLAHWTPIELLTISTGVVLVSNSIWLPETELAAHLHTASLALGIILLVLNIVLKFGEWRNKRKKDK